MPIAFQLVARAHRPHRPLDSVERRADLWRRLSIRFPQAIAAVLMPDHSHLLVWSPLPARATWLLAVELRAWTQRFHPGKAIWAPVPPAVPIPDRLHLRRQIRYVHLNPCRAGLVRDPLAWEWSTHLDLCGGIAHPWPNARRIGEVLGTGPRELHRYVSSDPSVAPAGTPPPGRPDGRIVADASAIRRAAEVALRRCSGPAPRTLAIHLADELGLRPDAAAFGCSLRTWQRALRVPRDLARVRAALHLLGDARTRF